MKCTRRILPIFLGLFFFSTAFGADTYSIDPAHSSIGFSVRHMVISNVKGRFTDFSGTLIYDEKDLSKSSVEITIKAASINTDVKQRDDHLRSGDFFDVAKYPDITFKSTRVDKKGEAYVAIGILTMHGVAKEVAIAFKIGGKARDGSGATHLGAEGTLKVNRQDYGVAWNRTLDDGGLMVGNDVQLELNIEAVKK